MSIPSDIELAKWLATPSNEEPPGIEMFPIKDYSVSKKRDLFPDKEPANSLKREGRASYEDEEEKKIRRSSLSSISEEKESKWQKYLKKSQTK